MGKFEEIFNSMWFIDGKPLVKHGHTSGNLKIRSGVKRGVSLVVRKVVDVYL